MPSTSRWSREVAPALLCCAALLVCLTLANPFVDAPFNDDWSYSHVALRFAQTGKFQYNGWGSPSIVFQTLWGALFIKLFGFSFNVLRYASLPFSLGMVGLTYGLARRVGLHRQMATFAALCLAVSPLFLPLAASFMTEPYSCCFSMLCVFAAVCCAQSENDLTAIYLLVLLTVSGILGGSDRQTVWIIPLALIPYLAYLKRGNARFLGVAACAFLAVVASMLFVVINFSQKYSPLLAGKKELLQLAYNNGIAAIHLIFGVILSCLLMSLPAFLCVTPKWKTIPVWHLCGLALGSLFLFDYLHSGMGPKWGVVPFAGNIITIFGVLDFWSDGLGFRPIVMTHLLTYPLTYFLLLAITTFTYLVLRAHCLVLPSKWSPATTIFALVILTYLPFLIPGGIQVWLFDRYMLPLLPLVLILILKATNAVVPRVSPSAWLCLAAFAISGILMTHDYFAVLAARSLTAAQATRNGIPANHISAGLERDAWFQLETTRHIKNPLSSDPLIREYDHFWFWYYTTAIDPEYVAITCRYPRIPEASVLTVPFTAWLPPFHRAVALVPQDKIPTNEYY